MFSFYVILTAPENNKSKQMNILNVNLLISKHLISIRAHEIIQDSEYNKNKTTGEG